LSAYSSFFFGCNPACLRLFNFNVFLGKWLGYAGEILVLFETPSGFAIFCYDGTRLFLPNAIQVFALNCSSVVLMCLLALFVSS
jgi:hypothetical protein